MKKKLSELFEIESDMTVFSIHSDSRYVLPYSVFFCIEGLTVDGHQYVSDAIFQGAKCIVHSKELTTYTKGIVYIKCDNPMDELNRVANVFYDYPSEKMNIIGVTGTNGKTITASLIEQVVSKSCLTGYIGTLSISYGSNEEVTPYTTPDSLFLLRHLERMEKMGVRVVSMEASSHGLALKRVDGVHFDIAVLTNIEKEHLDFHGTMEQYVNVKKSLFARLSENGVAVVNQDCHYVEEIKECCKAKIITYGIEKIADVMACNMLYGLHDTCFDLVIQNRSTSVKTSLIGPSNVYNILAVVGALLALGYDYDRIIVAIETMHCVPGRYEPIVTPQGVTVINDYCQSLRNFESLFQFVELTKKPKSRIIIVVGVPTKRNTKSRKALGKLVNEYCDHVILTQHDDKGQSVQAICRPIQEELTSITSVIVENRQVAIEQAMSIACQDDIVLVVGKGHEKFIALSVGQKEYPGDNAVVQLALNQIYQGEEEYEI